MIHAQNAIDTVMVSPVLTTAAGTNKVNIDTKGSEYLTLRVVFSAELNTNGVGPQIDVLHADVTDATSFVTITPQIAAHSLVSANELRYDIDLKGKKRYIRFESLVATATNDVYTFAVLGSLSRNAQEPATAAARNASTNDTVVTVD